jgi:hypothetical protein
LRRFLGGEIRAFELDDSLDEFRDSSDSAVRQIAIEAWNFYDDFEDHLVCFGKLEWDYFQRLLLLLGSDCGIDIERKWQWSWTQAAALLALLGYLAVGLRYGWGEHLLVFGIPFGVVSILLARFRRDRQTGSPYDQIVFPFTSFGQLKRIYESASDFRKSRYPREIGTRRIRSRGSHIAGLIPFYTGWLLCSPVPLFFQTLPKTIYRSRFVDAKLASSFS